MGVPYVIVYVECDRLGVKRCKPVSISVCVLVSSMTVLCGWLLREYMLALEVKQVRYIRSYSSVTSTPLQVQHLK